MTLHTPSLVAQSICRDLPGEPLIVPTPDYTVSRRQHPLFGDCVYAEWGPGFDQRVYCTAAEYVGVEVR